MKSIALCLSLLGCLALLAGSRPALAQEMESYTRVGQKVPSFEVSDLEGKRISMDDLKGKVVLVNFWATWCGPCLIEMPRLEKELWQKHKDAGFSMVAIAREQTEQEIKPFRDDYGFSFPLAADPDREIYKLFGNAGIPRSYVVGTDGKILYQSVGYEPGEFDRMKKVIEKELAKMTKAKAAR